MGKHSEIKRQAKAALQARHCCARAFSHMENTEQFRSEEMEVEECDDKTNLGPECEKPQEIQVEVFGLCPWGT